MSVFLSLLSDSDLEVRKASLLMVNAATHHHTDVIIPFLRDQVHTGMMMIIILNYLIDFLSLFRDIERELFASSDRLMNI